MTTEIYNTVKNALSTILGADSYPLFKTVMLWNSQTDHVLAEANDSYPWLSPACFIEFNNINCTNLSKKAQIQQCDYDMILHIVHDLRMNEDVSILDSKLKAYQKIQTLEFAMTEPTTGRLTRISENPNYDNNELQVYEQSYHSTYNDFSAVPIPNTGMVSNLIINQTIVTILP